MTSPTTIFRSDRLIEKGPVIPGLFKGINNDEDGDDYRNLSADAMDLIDSALAAQPGGSDNDQ